MCSLWDVAKSKHYRDEKAIQALAKRVKELRLATGKTIEQFANDADLHVTQYARIERGLNNPSISYVYLLARKFGVKPEDLIKLK